MNATEVQALNVGDRVKYAGHVLTVKDWSCHKDIVMFGNVRLWAEPIFAGPVTSIHPAFWNEIEPIGVQS